MPTYEYACTSCGEHVEVVQSFRDDPLTTCPACGGPLRKVFGSIGVVFKGSGFYKTDSRPAKESSTAKESKTAATSETSGSSKDGAASKEKASSSEGSSGSSSTDAGKPSKSDSPSTKTDRSPGKSGSSAAAS
ncbi:MAG TPA: FmdB family zinc ribbon protein [Acidimicrobiales bacterium]|nr:FmdB family zinc ribbon protein [Acidimicrobiales bacterium]